jgi:hypothetical protein
MKPWATGQVRKQQGQIRAGQRLEKHTNGSEVQSVSEYTEKRCMHWEKSRGRKNGKGKQNLTHGKNYLRYSMDTCEQHA